MRQGRARRVGPKVRNRRWRERQGSTAVDRYIIGVRSPNASPALNDLELADAPTLVRFREAVFEASGSRSLHRSIRIPPSRMDDYVDERRALVAALGGGSILLAGWYGNGVLARVAAVMAEQGKLLPVVPRSDLDLVLWRSSQDSIYEAMRAARATPVLLATPDPGWVLVSPLDSDDTFLYPEVAANGD